MTPQLLHGDCLTILPTLDANSIDAIVTDPPYGLAFMGKAWDHGVPGEPFWREALRVAKPGAHLVAFGGTRTYHRLACAIEDAGWEIRDCLMWLYGSGFPKSHNGPWGGTALKPAWEPIILARKPLAGTVAANVQAYGTGAINVDGCRIGTERLPSLVAGQSRLGTFERSVMVTPERIGRWPSNLLLDEGSAAVLDGQTGTSRSPSAPVRQGGRKVYATDRDYGERAGYGVGYGDTGGPSRFFYCAKASRKDRNEGCEALPAQFAPTMGNGIGGKEHDPATATPKNNHHPTVKPTDLMRWLVRLVTPPGGTVLDPFMGSGSTGKAARLEGCGFIGIEREAAYLDIARSRIRPHLTPDPHGVHSIHAHPPV